MITNNDIRDVQTRKDQERYSFSVLEKGSTCLHRVHRGNDRRIDEFEGLENLKISILRRGYFKIYPGPPPCTSRMI